MAGPDRRGYLAAVLVTAAFAAFTGGRQDTERDDAALPAAEPVRVEIPAIGVRAPVMPVGRAPDGTVQVPPLDEAHRVGWYRHGPAPGARGPAVLLGHYDDLRGPAVFHRLGRIRRGEVVRVERRDGRTAVFAVESVEQVPKSRFPAGKVYGPVDHAGLRLVTCGGSYDRARRTYRDNVIVYARLTTTR
ncbi:class F sortase [Thermomonospora cellulosilytica]|uniref:Sortase (Surface protein transpeptidase) n=1 Tax=Thermomonospora cellulosilytica TaxID=1411118 RepID=A0A7W3N0W2_9ACTN|nr:class F sortase [Thermomonospora cellulosilytica]MBA9005487.1 sortase (surface protein transpeptidase) [Thermomonospora cellulosilytica]